MMNDKSLVSNAAALGLIAIGMTIGGTVGAIVLSTGLFALSGAVTNWLAIHMLFERVPGLYGSGVIPLRFEEFKLGIRELIMEQFFDRIDVDAFLAGTPTEGESSGGASIADRVAAEVESTINGVDLDQAFERLLDVILASSFGGMLGMLGGREALSGLREPFAAEMRDYLSAQFSPDFIKRRIHDLLAAEESSPVREKLEQLIDARLDEMTPQIVKDVVQKMIKSHLGWLVVWGAVFGGALGLLVTSVQIMLSLRADERKRPV